jgi:hypothetical protein
MKLGEVLMSLFGRYFVVLSPIAKASSHLGEGI